MKIATNNTVVPVRAGSYTFLNYSAGGSGTAKIQVKDTTDANATYIDYVAAITGSGIIQVTVNGAASLKVVFTGDSSVSMLPMVTP